MEQAEELVEKMPDDACRLADRFWPGPLTLVLPKKDIVPDIVTAGLPGVAVRMPDHPLALMLIGGAATPIAAPSANRFGRVSPTTAQDVQMELGQEVDIILDGGPCPVGVESTVLSLCEDPPVLLRPGGLPLEEIELVIGSVRLSPNGRPQPLSPGQLPRHYAPSTPLVLTPCDEWELRGRRVGLLAFQRPQRPDVYAAIEVLSASGDLREAATNLFGAMRRLDSLGLDFILAERIPQVGLGRAVMDRLRKASAKPRSSARPNRVEH
jgi:L-threonylcarbamoyladenylate synthase